MPSVLVSTLLTPQGEMALEWPLKKTLDSSQAKSTISDLHPEEHHANRTAAPNITGGRASIYIPAQLSMPVLTVPGHPKHNV